MTLTGENRNIWREICPDVTLSTTNLTRTGPGSNPRLGAESPVTTAGTKTRLGKLNAM